MDGALLGDGIDLPPVPDTGLGSALLVLGGIVITVQGFETVRYLGDSTTRETRIARQPLAQFAARDLRGDRRAGHAADGTRHRGGRRRELLDARRARRPVLALPLVLCAVLSQFSAATADTAAASATCEVIVGPLQRPRSYVIGAAAALLAATPSTCIDRRVASRAFAAYYALQCVSRCAPRRRAAGSATARWPRDGCDTLLCVTWRRARCPACLEGARVRGCGPAASRRGTSGWPP